MAKSFTDTSDWHLSYSLTVLSNFMSFSHDTPFAPLWLSLRGGAFYSGSYAVTPAIVAEAALSGRCACETRRIPLTVVVRFSGVLCLIHWARHIGYSKGLSLGDATVVAWYGSTSHPVSSVSATRRSGLPPSVDTHSLV